MAFDVTGLGAQDALAQIAKMAYGSGRNEGVAGGKGNIGLVDGQVVKFNTHWTERLKSTTDEMRASCDELRRKLGTIAGDGRSVLLPHLRARREAVRSIGASRLRTSCS